jgi:hypothetical protein
MANASASHSGLSEDRPKEVDESKLHSILSNGRRREIIRHLVESDDRDTTVRDLSEHIAAKEAETDPAPREVRHSVYVSLQQNHVPKLDDEAVVDYERDAKRIAANERTDRYYRHLERSLDEDAGSPLLVFGLLFASLVVAFALLDGAPFNPVNELFVVGPLVLLQAGLATACYRECYA